MRGYDVALPGDTCDYLCRRHSNIWYLKTLLQSAVGWFGGCFSDGACNSIYLLWTSLNQYQKAFRLRVRISRRSMESCLWFAAGWSIVANCCMNRANSFYIQNFYGLPPAGPLSPIAAWIVHTTFISRIFLAEICALSELGCVWYKANSHNVTCKCCNKVL